MKEDVLDYIRKHPVWYVTLCHYPEKYDDLLDEIHQKKQSTVLEKPEKSTMDLYLMSVTARRLYVQKRQRRFF